MNPPPVRILFVSGGNRSGAVDPVVGQQAESLRRIGITVDHYLIQGSGAAGYLTNVKPLIRQINKTCPDLVHAHYSFSGFLATIACPPYRAPPVVVSLMGSDVFGGGLWPRVAHACVRLIWDATIVKSQQMMDRMPMSKRVHLIPNGVNLDLFTPMDSVMARARLGLDRGKHVLFIASDIQRPEKNYRLAEETIADLGDPSVHLLPVEKVPIEEMPLYFAAADALILTSRWEGSPNVIKEAMACACPLVATDVGDIRQLIDNVPGCYVAPSDPHELALKLRLALEHGRTPQARLRIGQLMSAHRTAQQIGDLYYMLIRQKSPNHRSP